MLTIAVLDSANYGLYKGLNADLPAYNNKPYLSRKAFRHPADNAIRRKIVGNAKILAVGAMLILAKA